MPDIGGLICALSGPLDTSSVGPRGAVDGSLVLTRLVPPLTFCGWILNRLGGGFLRSIDFFGATLLFDSAEALPALAL